MSSALEYVLNLYTSNREVVELIRDLLFILGIPPAAIFAIRELIKFRFHRITSNIKRDLQLRSDIEPDLGKYVLKNATRNRDDVSLRFVHWKNYPNFLKNDAFPHSLYVKYYNNDGTQPFADSWLSNLGIFIQEPLWQDSASCYVDANGIFFFSEEGERYRGFREFRNCRLRKCLPYSSIVAFDFRQYIEYEPVLYIRYPYNRWRKLYRNEMTLIGRDDSEHLFIKLDQRRWITKYSWYGYLFMKIRCKLFQ